MDIIRKYKIHKLLNNILLEKEIDLLNEIFYYFPFKKTNYKKIHLIFNDLIEKNLSKENNKKILFHLDMMEISYYKPSNQYYFSDSGENVLIVNGNYNSIDYIDSDYKKIYKFNKKLLKKYFRLEIENYEHTY